MTFNIPTSELPSISSVTKYFTAPRNDLIFLCARLTQNRINRTCYNSSLTVISDIHQKFQIHLFAINAVTFPIPKEVVRTLLINQFEFQLTQKTKLKMKRAYLTHSSELLRAVIPAVFSRCSLVLDLCNIWMRHAVCWNLSRWARFGSGSVLPVVNWMETNAAVCPRARAVGRNWSTPTEATQKTEIERSFFLSFFAYCVPLAAKNTSFVRVIV